MNEQNEKGNVFWYRSKKKIYGAVVLDVLHIDSFHFEYLVAISEELETIPNRVEEVTEAKLYTLAWFDLLLPELRRHSIGYLDRAESYNGKAGLLWEKDESLTIKNVGSSATWRHEWWALRYRDCKLSFTLDPQNLR